MIRAVIKSVTNVTLGEGWIVCHTPKKIAKMSKGHLESFKTHMFLGKIKPKVWFKYSL